jgi:hypothetical protein
MESADRRVAPTHSVAAVVYAMAPHDWLLLGQLLILLVLVMAGAGPTRGVALALLLGDLVWFLAALASVRATKPSRTASTFYRLSLIALAVATYVELRWILPVIAPGSVDADLLAFDLRVFHVEPALAWDHLVTPPTTEWFAFFYYSYFFILAIHAVPIAVGFDDGPDLREFALGLLALYCIGHVTYVLVPALGPHVHVQGFRNQLEGGVFWQLVKDMVEGAGAGKDVFPSLHTAAPLFLALYGYRHRARRPFRYVWPITAFFSLQIIVATMFLRWHYLVDIVAGIALAVGVWIIAPRVVAWEERRRRRAGLPPAFPESPVRSKRHALRTV